MPSQRRWETFVDEVKSPWIEQPLIHGDGAGQGNSDPFNTFAIPINASTNALMRYTREFYLPTRERDATNPTSKFRPEDWSKNP